MPAGAAEEGRNKQISCGSLEERKTREQSEQETQEVSLGSFRHVSASKLATQVLNLG